MTDQKQVLDILRKMAAKMEEQKEYLTELDRPIGDNDHGINMARGFAEVEKELPALEGKDIGGILQKTGMILLSKVGGSAGPLYGSAFMKAGMGLAGRTEASLEDFLKAMDTAVEAIMHRGKSTAGEKTMLDAMIPARDAMRAAFDAGSSAKAVLAEGVQAAWQGAEHTKDLVATKGRASYVGERSLGHQDPGATSFSYLLGVIKDCVAAAE